MRFKAGIVGLIATLSTGFVAADQPEEQSAKEGEVGYYFLQFVRTAPPRFVMRDYRELTADQVLQAKCPGAKLLSLEPVGRSHLNFPTFAISFTMPKQQCPGN